MEFILSTVSLLLIINGIEFNLAQVICLKLYNRAFYFAYRLLAAPNTPCTSRIRKHNLTIFSMNVRCLLLFKMLMANVREHLLPNQVIVGALLEYEPIPNLRSRVFRGGSFRNRKGPVSLCRQNTWQSRKPHYDRFMRALEDLFTLVTGDLHLNYFHSLSLALCWGDCFIYFL